MPYDEALAERLRELLPKATEKKMFGGIAWMERGNMLVGVMGDDLLARVAPADSDKLQKQKGVQPFTMGGKMPASKGWLVVEQEQLPEDEDLQAWIDRARSFTKTLPPK